MPRAGSAQQSAGASVSQSRSEAARPLCDLHGEQQPLPRSLRRRRTIRFLLHLREFLSDAGANSPTSSPTASSRILITSMAKLDVAREALKECPKVELCIVVDGAGESERIVGLQAGHRRIAEDADRRMNASAPRCSIRRARPAVRRASCGRCRSSRRRSNLPIFDFLQKLWQYREGMIYLSPAPLYHSAPQAAVNLTIRRAAPPSSWRVSIRSAISSWCSNGA